MAQHIVQLNQNIFDIALERYGSIEGIFDLLLSNDKLTMETDLVQNMILKYSEDFVINDAVVKEINTNGYVPANGEGHVYNNQSDYELVVLCVIDGHKTYSGLTVGGEGHIQIDWGDNFGLETVILSGEPKKYIHYFNNIAGSRKLKIYGDCVLTSFDSSDINGDIFLTKPLVVHEYTNKSNGNSLKGLFLFEETYMVDLQGMTISDLLPIADMSSLWQLNLLNVRFTNVSVLDDYLQYIVENYGTRRNCIVRLNTEPTERGMAAIQTIINEPAWNEGGKWEFIINETTYTNE
jgi:hypothetical protein